MLSRVATWLVGLATLIASAALLPATLCRPDARAPANPTGSCGGWTAVALPALELIDVAARSPTDVWLLTKRDVYHYDGCAWRAHQPFADLAGVIKWETIVADPDGAIVVTGMSPGGPTIRHGCVSEQKYPAGRVSYRFAKASWQPIAARPPSAPEVAVAATALGNARTIIATSGNDVLFAVVKHVRQYPDRDAMGAFLGYATRTGHELWRQRNGTWSSVLQPIYVDALRPEAVAALPPVEEINRMDGLAIDGQRRTDRPRSSMSWASGPHDVYVAGSPLRHFDGVRWSNVAIDGLINAVWGTARDDVWAGGSTGLWHFDGRTWNHARGDAWINALGGSGPHDVWAVGHRNDAMPEVLHFDGRTWTSHRDRLPRLQYRLTGVTSTGRDAWVVGNWGTVLYWNGAWWIEQPRLGFTDLDAVGVRDAVVWVAGNGVFRYE